MKPSNVHLKLIALGVAVTAFLAPSAGGRPGMVHDVQALSAAPLLHPCAPAPDIEGDTRIAVSPDDPKNIVASWVGFAPGGTIVSFSRDGGERWQQGVVPGHGGCSGAENPESFAADPGLAFDADGETLYLGSLNRTPDPRTGSTIPEEERVLISRSTTGGETWDDEPKEVPGVFTPGLGENHLLWLAADPEVSGRAYAVWTSYRSDAATAAFSQTTDGGDTWSPATIIYRLPVLGPRVDARGYVLRVLPDGSLLVVFAQNKDVRNAGSPWEIMAIRCDRECDRGTAWLGPFQVGTACFDEPRDSETGFRANIFRDATFDVGPDGTAYAAWHTIGTCTEHSTSRLLIATSTDRGKTWSEPQEVKHDVDNVCPGGTDQADQSHEPTLAVTRDGTVGVSFYDFRNDCPGDAELTTDIWFAHSHDGSPPWEEDHVAGPFNMRSFFDPIFQAFGVTDFNGLAPLPHGFAASFVQTAPAAGADCTAGGCALEPPTDIFFARLFTPARGKGETTTGGGWLADRAGGKVNFGFTARETVFGFEGELKLHDKGAGAKIDLTEVMFLGALGESCGSIPAGPSSLELRGDGTYNGARASFRVCVQDNGERGTSADRFLLACTTGCSYTTASRTLDDAIDGGNIHVGQAGEASEPVPTTIVLDPLLQSEAALGGVQTFTVAVYDQHHRRLPNTRVTLTTTTGAETIASLSAVTDADGTAAFLATTLGETAEYRATGGAVESNMIELSPLGL